MDEHAIRRWHDKREELFPTKIPYNALRVINEQLPGLDEEMAMAALVRYSNAKPYRGFYMAKFNEHYERVLKDQRRPPSSGTDSAQKRAAAPAANDGGDSFDSERRERAAYDALPDAYKSQCAVQYADWGWPQNSRAWRLICLDAYVGRPVDQYRIGTNVFTRDIERETEMKERQAFMERTGYVALIGALRAEIGRLGGNVDVCA